MGKAIAFDQALQAFSALDVVVLGDLFLDMFVGMSPQQGAVEDGAGVWSAQSPRMQLGGAGTVGRVARSMGARTRIVAVSGADSFSDVLKAHVVRTDGPELSLVEVRGRKTATKIRFQGEDGRNVIRVDWEDREGYSQATLDQLLDQVEARVTPQTVLLCADYARGSAALWRSDRFNELCRRVRYVAADSQSMPADLPRTMRLLKKNRAEDAALRAHLGLSRAPVEESFDQVFGRLNLESTVDKYLVTLDADGMVATSAGGEARKPSFLRRYVSEAGAGNAAFVVFGFCDLLGLSLDDACALASVAAALTMEKPGSDVCTLDEVRDAVRRL